MAQGDPKLPEIPGYTARYAGASAIPSVDPYAPIAATGLSKDFESFSSTLRRSMAVQDQKGNNEAIAKGRAWRLTSQKTFRQAVADGDIDPTQNPWFAVGAMETDGRLASQRLTGEIKAEWNGIVLDETDGRGRDPEGFTKLYDDRVEAFVKENVVDSHYWSNSFFETNHSWFYSNNPNYEAGSRLRYKAHETEKSLLSIEKGLSGYVSATTDPDRDTQLQNAQATIDTLHTQGLWTQDTKQKVVGGLLKLIVASPDAAKAKAFYEALEVGPAGEVTEQVDPNDPNKVVKTVAPRAKLHKQPYAEAEFGLHGDTIKGQVETQQRERHTKQRTQVREGIDIIGNPGYWQRNPKYTLDGTEYDRSELKTLLIQKIEDPNFFSLAEKEAMLPRVSAQDRYTTYAIEKMGANPEMYEVPLTTHQIETRAAFRNEVYNLGRPEVWWDAANKEEDEEYEKYEEEHVEWVNAGSPSGSEPVEPTPKTTKELVARAEDLAEKEGDYLERVLAGHHNSGVFSEDEASTVENLYTSIKNYEMRVQDQLKSFINDDSEVKLLAHQLYSAKLMPLIQKVFSADALVRMSNGNLDQELAEMFDNEAFADSMTKIGISQSDMKRHVLSQQSGILTGLLGVNGVDIQTLNAIYAQNNMPEYILEQDATTGAWHNRKGQNPESLWAETVRLTSTFYGEPNPYVTNAFEEEVVRFMKQAEVLGAGVRPDADMLNSVISRRAGVILETAYQMSAADGKGINESDYLIPPGGNVLERYIELRLAGDDRDAAIDQILTNGISAVRRIPSSKDAQALKTSMNEELGIGSDDLDNARRGFFDEWVLDPAERVSTILPQFRFGYEFFEWALGADEISRSEATITTIQAFLDEKVAEGLQRRMTKPGQSPQTAQKNVQDHVIRNTVVDPEGTFYSSYPEPLGRNGQPIYRFSELKEEGELDDVNDFILSSLFPYEGMDKDELTTQVFMQSLYDHTIPDPLNPGKVRHVAGNVVAKEQAIRNAGGNEGFDVLYALDINYEDIIIMPRDAEWSEFGLWNARTGQPISGVTITGEQYKEMYDAWLPSSLSLDPSLRWDKVKDAYFRGKFVIPNHPF